MQPSYWKRAFRFSFGNTKTFHPIKVLPAILAAFARLYFGKGGPLKETILIVLASTGTYILCYVVDFLWKMLIVAPMRIDAEHIGTEAELRETIKALQSKPTRTNAEQHRYEQAKRALDELGLDAMTVLRHLRAHEELMFSGNSFPILPDGMNQINLRVALDNCARKHLVSVKTVMRQTGAIYPIQDDTYQIAPGMKAALDELLYE